MDLTIWTINRCTELLGQEDRNIQNIFSRNGAVSFGERSGTVRESPRQLMPDREYFVPIPLKCIGGKYRNPNSAGDSALLQAITAAYPNQFGDGEFGKWWTESARLKAPHVPDSLKPQMMTPTGVGYYELIEKHENNILIGYSQGGLVARYLAFLDRYVFRRHKILAVFTVSSPNYGSPLGNPANQNFVTAGLLEVLASLVSFHKARFPTLYGKIDANVSFDAFYEALKAARQDAEPDEKAKPTLPAHEALPLLDTAVKWLSGLHGDTNTAFGEIGTNNFAKDLSVLSLVDDPNRPPQVYTGSVISANSDLNEILRSLVLGGRPTLVERIRQFFEEMALEAVRHFRIFGIQIRDNEKAASNVYSDCVMKEAIGDNSPEQLKKLQQLYRTGVGVEKPLGSKGAVVPAFAHDYIIPSVDKMLPPDDLLLAQFVNIEASHNSGKSPRLKAGSANVEALKKLMRKLNVALIAQRNSQ